MRFSGTILLALMCWGLALAQGGDVRLNIEWGERAFGEEGPPPISFVYGGKPSSELLPNWERTVAEGVEDGANVRSISFKCPDTGFEVNARCSVYADTPGVDWTIYFTNRGETNSAVLESVNALNTSIPLAHANVTPVLHQLRGSTAIATDWQPYDTPLGAGGRIDIVPQSGRSSKEACPFFTCSWPGGGVVTAIGWTGRWRAAVYNENLTLHIKVGLQHLRTTLKPGETIRGPRVMQLYWTGDDPWRGYNAFRRTMLRHIMPRVDGQPVTPPIAHTGTSFYEMDDGTEADVLSHLESTKGLGFEYFWQDAFRGRERFPKIGHYVFPIEREVDANRFPNGLAPIGQAVHNAGMKFLLWFEPERISPGGLMAAEHPEWVVMPPPERMGHGGMLNLAIPEACEYTTRYLNTAIKEYRIDCLRIDNAVDYGVTWGILDEGDPERVGMAEIRYVEGHYRMWDDILAAHPRLFIDNCASGGQRIDLETCARSIPLWRTDGTINPLMARDYNEAAIRNQVITAGLSRYLPYHTSGQMGACPYHFRSGFNAGTSFCEDIRAEDYPRDLLAQGIAEGKRIRKYYAGDFYALSDVTTSPKEWCVLQYDRLAEGDGMVVAFRRHASPYAAYVCPLRGINPDAEYDVTASQGYAPEPTVRMKGVALQSLKAEIDEMPGSLIIEYKRVD
jgi:alpha-galactosidase